MKKNRIGIILAIGVCVSLTISGCGINRSQFAQQEGEEMNSEYMDWDTLTGSVKFPEQYWITYEIDQKDGSVISITKAKDSVGNIYYKDEKTEIVFKKNGTTYRVYQRQQGNYVEDTSAKYKDAYIEEQSQQFLSCAQQNNIMAGSAIKYMGDTTVLQRDCKEYGIELTVINYMQNYIFTFDEQTGICLKKTVESKVGESYENSVNSFVCTEFMTEDVSFEVP